jgi:hypothetical protein
MNEIMTGREAYEADCAARPLYPNGRPRLTWEELPAYAKASWNKGARLLNAKREMPK